MREQTDIMRTIDIIIPTYKPDEKFICLIEMLEKQTILPNRIIVTNTEEKYYQQLIFGTNFIKKYRNIEIKHHSKREFNHGRTRRNALKRSDADIFICMTQDAVPADEFLIEKLVQALENEHVAVAYARQLPEKESTMIECFTRNFNYPNESRIKSKEDIESLGIKTYFCSNVCAAYKRSVYDELGGFIKHTIFNEDMIFAAGAVNAGYSIAYVAEAKVIHAHKYTNKKQFQRNFDLGVSQAEHPEVFEGLSSQSEGIRFVKLASAYLKASGKRNLIFSLYVQSAYKYLGYRLGKNFKKLPKKVVIACSDNKNYWKQKSIVTASAGIDSTRGYGKSQEEISYKGGK